MERGNGERRIDAQTMKAALQLYFVMGSTNVRSGQEPADVVSEAIAGGVTLFQWREKGPGARTGEEKIQLGHRLKQVCHASGVPFIVNDDVELALELDADGVHVGQEDAEIVIVRKRIGNKILGVSTHNVAEAEEALRHGADYIGVGPMYATSTKQDIREVRGPIVIEEIRRVLPDIPIVGIGGINLQRARPVMEAGADGVAVISAIAGAEDAKTAAQQLVRELGLFTK